MWHDDRLRGAAMTTPRTAGEIAEIPAQRAPQRRPADLGAADGPSVMVNAEDLATMLRDLVPSGADIGYSSGWWTLRCFGGTVAVGGSSLDELAARAVAELRALVDGVDPHTRAPLVWLVRLSTDRALRRWLNIPG